MGGRLIRDMKRRRRTILLKLASVRPVKVLVLRAEELVVDSF